MMSYDIVVVGSCNVDHTTYCKRFPVAGETIHGHRYVTGLGGKGANQCVAATKLGAKAAMIGKVGTDVDGENFKRKFQSLGINIEYVYETEECSTGIAAITVADNGNNSIVIVSGANLLLQPVDIDNVKGIFDGARIMLCQLEIPLETTLKALRLAKSKNITTLFNPAPAPKQILSEEFYILSTILCCNETEAFALTGMNVTDVQSAMKAVMVLIDKGCKIGILTLGENGCVYLQKGNSTPTHVLPREVKAVDTTGAGDAFVGALAFFMVRFESLSLHEKIRRASYIASVSVCKNGTQSSYPSLQDLKPSVFSLEEMLW